MRCVIENEYGRLPAVRLVETREGKVTVHVGNLAESEDIDDDGYQVYHVFVELNRTDAVAVDGTIDVEVLEDGGSVYGIAETRAKDFFEAYVTGNIENATELMDSPDNSCLEWFSDSDCIGSMDRITYCETEIINCFYDEENDLHCVRIDVAFDIDDECDINYMALTLVTKAVFGGDWKVEDFVFEA